MTEEKDAIKELNRRVKVLEKSVEKLKERPSMYELMGMTDPNEPWIGEGYKKIQAEISARDTAKESPISRGELVVKKKDDVTLPSE